MLNLCQEMDEIEKDETKRTRLNYLNHVHNYMLSELKKIRNPDEKNDPDCFFNNL